MVKGLHGQYLPTDVTQVIDQLERHGLAPDGSLISKPLYNDLQLVIFSNFTESVISQKNKKTGTLGLIKKKKN